MMKFIAQRLVVVIATLVLAILIGLLVWLAVTVWAGALA